MPGIEWIVVDGKSTDGSLAYLSDFERKPDILISERDLGIYDAMNKGIKLASGYYINFMNSGDFFEKNFFNNCIQEFDGSSDIIYGNTELSNGTFKKYPPTLDFFYIFNRMINHQSVFIKRSLLMKYPFDLNYKIVADWVMLFKILKFENPKINYIDQTVCNYDITGLSSRFDAERKSEKIVFLKTMYSEWELNDLLRYSKIRIRDWYQLIEMAIDSSKLGVLFRLLIKFIRCFRN
jgi:glycosyltransferase involved in cell wall biosynthesis